MIIYMYVYMYMYNIDSHWLNLVHTLQLTPFSIMLTKGI